jgi:hypothetical protein
MCLALSVPCVGEDQGIILDDQSIAQRPEVQAVLRHWRDVDEIPVSAMVEQHGAIVGPGTNFFINVKGPYSEDEGRTMLADLKRTLDALSIQDFAIWVGGSDEASCPPGLKPEDLAIGGAYMLQTTPDGNLISPYHFSITRGDGCWCPITPSAAP